MSRKTSTTVYLTEELLQQLRTASRETKVPMAELIRQGVQRQLDWMASNDPVG